MPLLGHASVADDPRTAVADRLRSARAAATVAATAGRGEEALRWYRTAVSLIAQLTPRALRRDDRRYRLSPEPELGCDAAACALSLGRPRLAAELLEQSRGILLAQTLDDRGDLAGLRAAEPELATALDELREGADRAAQRGPPQL